jgi:ubiquinone biosynthesis protein
MTTAADFEGANNRNGRSAVAPQRVRRFLERLGPIFVKFGQHLALCPDLLPRQYCDELLRLEDRVDPLAFDEVRQIITGDLGAPAEERYSWINPRPLTSGYLTQAHTARTKDGKEADIKIQRPGMSDVVSHE